MNKFLAIGLIAGAGALMASCSKDASNSDFSQNAIEFGTYLGRDAQTKGKVTKGITKFGVLAYYTKGEDFNATTSTPNFMYNQEVNGTEGGNWTYSPIKYWPTAVGDKISFFAYAPMVAKSNENFTLSDNTKTGTPTINVTYPADLTQMVDLVAGVAMNKTKAKGNATEDVVTFTLKHEMSRVGISAKVSEDVYKNDGTANKTKVVITGIKFNNVTDGDFYTSGKYTFSTTDEGRGNWSDLTTGELNLSSILKSGSVKMANEKYSKDNAIALENSTAVSLFKDDNYLFLIPAKNADGVAENKTTVTISYDIVTEDANLSNGYSCTSATKTVYLPTGTLKQGVAYNYVFTIAVDKVVLSATVENWTEPTTGNNINVPYTPDDATNTTTPQA